jgi:hypothetical protein
VSPVGWQACHLKWMRDFFEASISFISRLCDCSPIVDLAEQNFVQQCEYFVSKDFCIAAAFSRDQRLSAVHR